MPMQVILQLKKFGGPRIPSVLESMISSYVRHALSASTDLDGALSVFAHDAETLPLAWRPFDSPRHWRGECMAGGMRKVLDGDFSGWPRRLHGAVRGLVEAGRAEVAACRPRRVQVATYAAAFSALFSDSR